MKLFECQGCGQMLFFENVRCERCGRQLGFLPERLTLSALDPAGEGRWRALAGSRRLWRFCANAQHGACNWLVPAGGKAELCRACLLNRTIPNLEEPQHQVLWQRIEMAKHRLVYGLLRLGLPLPSKAEEPEKGLAFDFLAGTPQPGEDGPGVVTGHASGLITLDIAEADPVQRERLRRELYEPYRTLLGHFRHEIGHYYWERLIDDPGRHEEFRALFGDERTDYGAALSAHYAQGPQPPTWQESFISSYAKAHPWEDFAETWAHYLHIVDTLETGASFGLRIRPKAGRDRGLAVAIDFDPYREENLERMIQAWFPLTYAVNELNHSMDQPDLYPFILAPKVIEKLSFVHRLVHQDAAPRN